MSQFKQPRILIGRIFHEGHGFNPIPTDDLDFAVSRGEALISEAESAGTILAGITGYLTERRIPMIPVLSAMARPGGPIKHAVFARFAAELVDMARQEQPDGVFLELHGASITDEDFDPEGTLLEQLRSVLGEGAVIAVGLDLHAHVTPRMVKACNICIACKTNPHADFPQTGRKLAKLGLAALAGEIAPRVAYLRIPMLASAGLETDRSPLREIHALARRYEAEDRCLLDVSILNGHAYIDEPHAGHSVVATHAGDENGITGHLRSLAIALWNAREEFEDDLPSIDDAIDWALANPQDRPFVFGVFGDRVLAGAPGDDNAVARRLIERRLTLRAAIPITDPKAVSAAAAAGLGADITLAVGGTFSASVAPITIRGRVRSLTNGDFTIAGPMMAGDRASLGKTAIVESGPLTFVLSSRSGMTHDPNAFTSQGLALDRFDIIVAQSGYHFRLNFEGLATPVVVGSPGPTFYRKGVFSYKLARPIWPEDDIDFAEMLEGATLSSRDAVSDTP